MGKKSQPAPPDPYKVSDAEAKANKETAAYNLSMNTIDQSNPFGSVSYQNTGVDPVTGAPKYSQTTTLSPELQNLFDQQIGAQSGISSAISGTLGNLPTDPFNPNINTDDVRQRSYDSQMALLAPGFEKGMTDLQGNLSDRGIPVGSQIWNNQMGEYNRAKDSSLLAAARQADLDASGEAQRQYGNALQQYMLPYQQLGSLMGNSQQVGNPQFSAYPTASAAAPNTSQNIWNAYNSQVQQAQNNQSNMMGGLLGLGKLGLGAYESGALGALAALSDRRLKTDIARIGALPSGLPVYSFRYLWSDAPHIGVMAQETLSYFPDAVIMLDSGYMAVDYARIG